MSIDAVALVRIPEWEPSEDLDVRELDDGVLIFLDVPFESDPDTIFDALESLVGEEFYDHDDDRGILVFPDAAEPEDADSYEAVVAAVGESGVWLSLDAPSDDQAPNPEAILGQLLEAMGGGSADDLVRALRDGDEDALKLAQIQMTGAMEKAFKTDPDSEPDGGDKKS
jgi:hypothetical protein